MDTESLVAIICIVVALVFLLSMTIFTLVKAWTQISRELAEREQCQRSLAHTYENTDCIENEHALDANDAGYSEHAQAATDRGQTADSHDHSEVSCTHSDQAVNKKVLVQVETNDTSF